MAEYYDHYHRWEPLAEFHFHMDNENDEIDDENYIYCLCSRAFIRDGVKTYYADKEEASESDAEVLNDSHSQEWDDHSHVHFSLDTSYKVKCEKDEGASCYCSASHTDNCCSTDEHDPAHMPGHSHVLQPSDSGADLTYQDYHSETHEKTEKMDQDFQMLVGSEEDYCSEVTWEKFWAVNGERIIWASWIGKYSDYINPAYLDGNNDLMMDENNIPKQRSVEPIINQEAPKVENDEMRERKFSYDSKVNPYKKGGAHNQLEKNDKSDSTGNDGWLSIGRRRSCSEHERIISPRTVTATDSMTNVTRMTVSSYDVTSSHVTSDSSPTDDYSVSSSTSDDQSNDQTRIANIDDSLDYVPSEEFDTEHYWQLLWKKHFGEQYALHYANYIERTSPNRDLPEISIEHIPDKKEKMDKLDIECENSEGNSQEMPTIIEVQTQVDQIKLDDKPPKVKKRNKKTSNRLRGSVGVLLQSLLKEEQNKSDFHEIEEAGEVTEPKDKELPKEAVDSSSTMNVQQTVTSNYTSYSYDDGEDDPPEETAVTLKRSHELDEEETVAEKIKSTFEIMGFCLNEDEMPKGRLVYRKRLARLRPPRYKRFTSRKTYFDEEGNPLQMEQNKEESQDEREMQTDEECTEVKVATDKITAPIVSNDEIDNNVEVNIASGKEGIAESNVHSVASIVNSEDRMTADAMAAPLPLDEHSSDSQENNDIEKCEDSILENAVTSDVSKRRRRQKRYSKLEGEREELPTELRDDPELFKYWKKRHSLFHRFDEGIKLDRESWFSVTPESVAWHIANKYAYDVVLDAFCGAGGNTIQFARTCKKVIAIDIDPAKIEMARHNAAVYGVEDRIEFMVGDFFELAPDLQADMVFLSPPWGGPKYSENQHYDIETMLEPRPATELMSVARTISPNISLYLPRNSRSNQILSLAKEVGGSVEVEQSYLDKRFVAITAYFY